MNKLIAALIAGLFAAGTAFAADAPAKKEEAKAAKPAASAASAAKKEEAKK